MATKRRNDSEVEAMLNGADEESQEDDTRTQLVQETVELRKVVEAFSTSMKADFHLTRELVGRLEDKVNALHEKQNKIQEAWESMRQAMAKHHLETSSGAQTVGGIVRKCNDRLGVMEKSLATMTDPHKVINPLKIQVAGAMDEMAKLKASIDRNIEAFKEEIYSKTAELRRVGKPRVS